MQLSVRAASLGQVLDHDAPVSSSAGSVATPRLPGGAEMPAPKGAAKRARTERVHKVGEDGNLTHNRKGAEALQRLPDRRVH